MESICSKLENYRLCHAGAYGNRLRQWDSIEAWKASGYGEPVCMRTALHAGGGPKRFFVRPEEVESLAALWKIEHKVPRDRIRLSEMADGVRVLQGQYFNGVVEIDGEVRNGVFKLTFASGPIPIALQAHQKTVYGLTATLLIQHFMTPSSFSDFQELLDRYPDHVLEFSVWESCIGDTPGRNAVVWEIRKY